VGVDGLYRPYQWQQGGRSLGVIFRDHYMSDLIGFVYSKMEASHAAADFLDRIRQNCSGILANGRDALLPIILDGENAWEYYYLNGRPFLRELYRRISEEPMKSMMRAVTVSEALRLMSPEPLDHIFPGSWINANFDVWIGAEEDNDAWTQLLRARATYDAAAGVPEERRRLAFEELLIAEGSDWCWWYGDDHSSPHDDEFDCLFRTHLRNAYRRLQVPVPDELFVTNISSVAPSATQTLPTSLLAPTLDGEETSYFEWLGAGTLEVRDVAGAMHQAERPASSVSLVHFGFDAGRLYVRVDFPGRAIDVLAGGREVSLKFVTPAGVRFSVREDGGRFTGGFWDRLVAEPHWAPRGPGGAVIAAGTILELAIPLVDLGLAAGQTTAFFVAIYEGGGGELERHPANRPIELVVPDALFDARLWRV
jgi:hypothetical protein